MLPTDARLREAAMALLALERDIFGAWCGWLFRPLDEAGEQRAQASFTKAMQMVDDALLKVGGCGPFFLGEKISMVDLMFVPFQERQNASLLYWKGFRIRNGGYANIDRHADHPSTCDDKCPGQMFGVCQPIVVGLFSPKAL
jgi:glutathione S-transferase